MSDLVGNPEDRFSCVAAHLWTSIVNISIFLHDRLGKDITIAKNNKWDNNGSHGNNQTEINTINKLG